MSEWRETTLGEVAEVNPREPPLGHDAPFITMADVEPWGTWARSTSLRGDRGGVRARGGDVLMARITPCLENGKIGKVPEHLDQVGGSTEFIVLRGTESVSSDFLFLWASSPGIHAAAVALMTGSTGRQRVSALDIRNLYLHLPPPEEQRRIVIILAAVDKQVYALEEEVALVAKTLMAQQSQLPAGAKVLQIGGFLSNARAGGTPNRKRKDFYGGPIPWLKSGEVANPDIKVTEEGITEAGLRASSARLVPAENVVVAMYGATAGQVGYLRRSMATNQAVLALIPDREKADSRFLYYWMRSRSADLKKSASGAAQPNLSKGVVLAEAGFPALSLNDQVKVATELDATASMESASRAELTSLRNLRAALLTALLSQSTTIPESYDALLDAGPAGTVAEGVTA